MSRVLPKGLGLFLLLLVAGTGGAGAESAWPDPPAADSTDELRGEEAEDYRFAAALYRAIEADLASGNPNLLSSDDAGRLARALLVQGQGSRAAALLAARDDLPSELSLQLAMHGAAEEWSDLDRNRWLALFDGQDGESLYWRGRLSTWLEDRDSARRAFEELLRREPGSVFAPPALEALREIAALSEGRSDRKGETEIKTTPADTGGLRIQWGVYRDARGALRQRDALRAYGQSAEILSFHKDGTELFRVCSPILTDAEEARRLGESLTRRYGLDFVLLHQQDGGEAP